MPEPVAVISRAVGAAAVVLLLGAGCMFDLGQAWPDGSTADLNADRSTADASTSDSGTSPPDNALVDEGAQPADKGTPLADQSKPPLDQAPPMPDKGKPLPDKAVPKPDKALPKPDMALPKPDKALPKPDKALPKPDTFKPCAGLTCPLGCHATGARCKRLKPSNIDPATFHNKVSATVLLKAATAEINTATGIIRDGATVLRPAGAAGTIQKGIYWGGSRRPRDTQSCRSSARSS